MIKRRIEKEKIKEQKKKEREQKQEKRLKKLESIEHRIDGLIEKSSREL